MDEIRTTIQDMLNRCGRIHNLFNMELTKYPEGRLFCYNRKGKANYFHAEEIDGKTIRHGITRDEYKIHQLARKCYVEEADKRIIKNIEVLNKALHNFQSLDGDDILEKMPFAYRRLPKSFFLTRPMDLNISQNRNTADAVFEELDKIPNGYHKVTEGIYIPDSLRDAAIQGTLTGRQKDQIRKIQRKWANQDYPKNTKNLEHKKIITSQGLKVRSMAEGSISEQIYEQDIPFRHDQLIKVGNKTVSPDFSFLSIIRGEIHWEHCGLTNSQKYIEYYKHKRELYESIGFEPWINFIFTFNEENGFFDTREIEAIIKNKLMRWLYLD